LVLKSAEEGKLGLGDRMGKFIPEFNKYSKGYITLEQSLAHLTGIEPEPLISLPVPEKSKFSTLEEAVSASTSKKQIQSPPGRDFRWGDPGMDYAGRALELASKKGFEQLMQEKILRPLQMRNTQFSAFPYTQPSMGALSSAGDLLQFLACLLNNGQWNGKTILSPAIVDQLLAAAATRAMVKSAPEAYQQWSPALGNWVLATDEKGKSTINAANPLTGTWAILDRCRGYALVIVAGKPMNDDKKEICWQIKAALDSQINAACQ
jgi:CubicO group peptidase (beta-lactamase class C family)